MASQREPRHNAGNRMNKVMEGEADEDDFYKTTYGGFMEEEEDNDFDSGQEDSADEVDSDFDRSEVEDEPISDEENGDKPKRRKKGVVTKAYKEPSTVVKKPVKKSEQSVPKHSKPETEDQAKSPEKNRKIDDQDGPMRKSSRRSTATNSLLTSIRRKEQEEKHKKKRESGRKPPVGIRRLTQEELLAEAEKTEKKNLKSLENYQRLEANRKKTMAKKRTFDGPTVKYISTTMTVAPNTNNVDVEKVDSPLTNPDAKNKTSQNFVVFSHDAIFHDTFKWKRSRPRPKPFCVVTNKPARFIDPLTKIPYYDLAAFKKIREAYSLTITELKDGPTR
uniref:Vacuolar protein sorting-associated protein 72 homolog n=1 Tax=Phallusia mammillata TaxID=59560 RepID=A0A6F9DXB9_9ASCI|nr:TCFL1 protein [Phallusia mammillata]